MVRHAQPLIPPALTICDMRRGSKMCLARTRLGYRRYRRKATGTSQEAPEFRGKESEAAGLARVARTYY